MILIDIAVPRDIAADVDELENVYLYNIDHLESIVRENSRMREQELSKCNEIITGRATALIARLYPVQTEPRELPSVPDWGVWGAAATD